ncbi:hypothetical protein GAO09_08955 [Rhizobiales bacterium RZME27]|uniref:Uncharacterized protein n=1 Tax=Endobacterium cereale TaxID=2663029 RepID=A0A6A8A8F2_9HYPH|nr:hypothetical protein [Endobacterium cereale]MQY46177.1 hypothetical protein [Endobacterium cereale]
MVAKGVGETDAVPDEVARMEAERLLADPRLHVSDRHKLFLRYIIDALFEGRSDSVKAYSIAIDVFNRPPTFDPSSDPIVRIEATRLREALAKYYELLGEEEGVRLDIARGRYIPIFSPRSHKPCLEEICSEDEVLPPETRPVPNLGRALPIKGTLVAIFAVTVAVGGSYAAYRQLTVSRADTDRPVVELNLTGSPAGWEPDMLAENLSSSMTRFGTVRLRDTPKTRGATTSVGQSSYVVTVRYTEDANGASLRSRVSDPATGETIWTSEDRRNTSDKPRELALEELVYAVSRKIAGPVGIVNVSELRQNLPISTTGNICVLRGETAVEQRSRGGLKAVRPCLEATIAADPGDADAMATLARVYLWTGRADGDPSFFARGLELANRATTSAPSSPRAALAQLATQYQVGQNDTSIAAGRRGLVLNPENADLRAKLAMAVFLSGYWEEGVRLAREAVDLAGESIRDASFVMILDAYRNGQYAEAASLARQIPAADTPTAILKLAAVARLGDKTATSKEIATARMQHPDLDKVVSAMLTGTRYNSDLEDALRQGIEASGLTSPEFAANGPL